MSLSELLPKIQWVNIFKGLICSSLNIVIYILIALFILGFAQGYVIPVDLYFHDNWVALLYNILLFHFLIYFLGLIMSLYPTYIYSFLFEKNQTKSYTSNCWGLIYYTINGEKQCKTFKDAQENKNVDYKSLRFIEGIVRKFLGILLFIGWSWLVVYVYYNLQINFQLKIIVLIINIIFTITALFAFWFITFKVKGMIGENERYIELANSYHKLYIPFFLVVIGLFCIIVWLFKWHFITVISQLGICLLLSMHLLIYRTFRAYNKWICNIVNYLCLHRTFGCIVLIFLIVTNICTGLAEMTNPINLVLGYLIAFYTVIIIVFKIYLFLKNKNKHGKVNYIRFIKMKLTGYSYFLLFGIIFIIANLISGTPLHQLILVDEPKNRIDLSGFYEKFKKANEENESSILYAAYGGGLKAHYWNYMILDKLDKKNKFNSILAMSGVSGGGMGIGNFTAMKYLKLSNEEKETAIAKVKGSNILSIELSWLFGADLIRESLPSQLVFGHDRSYRSMQHYTGILNAPELLDTISFFEVYSKLNQDKDSTYYPNIIINSTSTFDKYGVVSAIVNDTLFPGASNLLDIDIKGESKTLTYFEALSTCNRFPVISPTANVPTKGYFVDGGYYENSGIMSLISFRNALLKFECGLNVQENFISNQRMKLVSVRNEKRNYLQSLLARNNLDYYHIQDNNLIKTKDYNETKSIVKGIANLERMPNYIKSSLERYNNNMIDFIDIDLPYYIKLSEINALFGGELEPRILTKVKTLIVESNEEIKSVLRKPKWKHYKLDDWGIVNPPTARVLSIPVEIYMEAMIEHEYVVSQLEKI